MRRSYLPAPNFDCSIDGPIVLGAILENPLDPESPLSTGLPIDDETIRKHVQHKVRMSLEKGRSGMGGFFASILENIGLEVSGSRTTNSQTVATFDELHTLYFEPSDKYMASSLATRKVQDYLSGGQKQLFVITGIKVGYGGKVSDTEGCTSNGTLSLGVDSAATGIPMSLGPQGKLSRGSSQTVSFEEAAPFVFAYRLSEIRYRKGVLKSGPYVDGAMYSVEGKKRADEEGLEPEQMIFLCLDDEDVTEEDVDGLVEVGEVGDDEQDEVSEPDGSEVCYLRRL